MRHRYRCNYVRFRTCHWKEPKLIQTCIDLGWMLTFLKPKPLFFKDWAVSLKCEEQKCKSLFYLSLCPSSPYARSSPVVPLCWFLLLWRHCNCAHLNADFPGQILLQANMLCRWLHFPAVLETWLCKQHC